MAKILVVEDEEKIARFIELELQHEGYETGKAADGRAGLEMAESGRYDLMLLDIMLPQLNGWRCCAGCVNPQACPSSCLPRVMRSWIR